MKQYRAKEVISLAAGSVVQLSEKQAGDRAGRIERLGPGRYRFKEELQFKAGEAFGYDGEIPKVLADLVEDLGGKKTPAEKKSEGASAGEKNDGKSGGLFGKAVDAAKDLVR